jgi:hypothetical protein
MPEQDLEQLLEFKGEKLFLKAFAELAEAPGENGEGKQQRLEDARKLFGQQ